jgi:anti-sigma regulatory factor (Ser/Thr protein kinase)
MMTDLPRDPLSPGQARQVTRQALAGWGFSPDSDFAYGCVLCVSEAVTNAVVHGRGSIRLTLSLADDRSVSVAVHDDGPMIPAQRRNPEHGRGLEIIARVTGSLEIIPDATGKTVAFTLVPQSARTAVMA